MPRILPHNLSAGLKVVISLSLDQNVAHRRLGSTPQ